MQRYRPRGDAFRAKSSRFYTDGSRRAHVLDVTGIANKRQVVPLLTDVASSAALLGRLSDDHAMPVSSNLAHAQTSAIDSAVAVAVKTHTTGVTRACEHLGRKDISRISVFPFPSSINPFDAAQQLTRSVKASASDVLMMLQRRQV